ncbi:MAG: hypothetical protein HGB02_05300 [Chlorobiaceae bacterium]|nr:hypothetical protein [Chlorobiaceae bacterium]
MKQFFRQSPVLLVCRLALAFSWIYQGAVPKIVCKSPGEVGLIAPIAPAYRIACTLITWMGYGEIVFGLLLLVAGRWLFGLNVAVLLLLLGWVAVVDPGMFTLPFNPLTLNVSLIGLSLIALYELNRPDPDGMR